MLIRKTGLAVLAAIIAVGSAQAQGFLRDRNTSVRERDDIGFTANGIDVGAFRLFPTLTTGLAYDDNARGTEENRESSGVFTFSPRINVDSQWARHKLTFFGDVDVREVLNAEEQSTVDVRFGADGRLDLPRNFELGGFANRDVFNERRSARTVAPGEVSVEPIQADRSRIGLSLAREFNRFLFSGEISQSTFDFDDTVTSEGTEIDQDFRDRDEWTGSVRGAFALTPAASVFGELAYTELEYDLLEPGVQDRSGSSFGRSIGADFDFTRLIRGEAVVGFQTREFDNSVPGLPPRDEQDTFSVRSSLEWFATPIITATFGASRALEETGLESTSLNLRTRGFARADYELRRNLILTAELALQNEQFDDFGINPDTLALVDREDDVFEASFGGVYRLNRFVGIEAVYRRFEREVNFSDDPTVITDVDLGDGEITNNSFGANLVVRY